MPKKRKDGYFKTTFTYHKKRYYVYGKTKQELFMKEKQKREELESHFNKKINPTLKEYFEQWMYRRLGTVSEASILVNNTYFNAINKIQMKGEKRSFGEMLIQDITIDDLVYLQRSLTAEGKKSTTVNECTNLVKRLLQSAEEERIIQRSPGCMLKNLKRTEEKARNTIHRALTQKEQETLFGSLEMKTNWYYNVFKFALYTGMRIGEIAALKFSDIKDNKIYVKRTLTKNSEGGMIIGTDAKTLSGVRTIPLFPEAREIIKEQKNDLLRRNNNIIDIDHLIFHRKNGNHIDCSEPGRVLKKICKALGIEGITTHALRATFATRCIESGMDVRTLQEIMGHKDYGVTMNLYGHVVEDTKEKEMKKVNIII